MYFRGSSLFSYNGKILFVSGEGKYASILDTEDRTAEEILLYPDYPEYEVSPDGLNPRRKYGCALGMYSFATERYIYLSPLKRKMDASGRYEPSDYKSYPPYYTDEIDVFDWDGGYVRTYRMDVPFCNYYVNEDEHVLYALTCDTDTMLSELHRYDMTD